MADFLDELKEDIQHEKFHHLWEQWGGVVIGAAIVLLVISAIIPFWNSYQLDQMKITAARYEKAVSLLDRGNADEGKKQLKELMNGHTGYATLAALQLAGVENSANQPRDEAVDKKIAKLYEETNTDPALHGLSAYITILHDLKSSDPKKALTLIDMMNAPDYPYRAIGSQLMAVYHLTQGDKVKAIEALNQLKEDQIINPDLRSRAHLIASYLKQS